MIPVFPARRRADEFAQLVEDSSTSGLSDARFSDLLQLVRELQETPPVEPRPEFVTSLRERLLIEAQTVLVTREAERLLLPERRPARDRRIAAAVGGFALVGVTTSVALAAQSALPGDVLYPIKRAIENVETSVRTDDAARGQSLLANAAGRLDEVAALSRGGDTVSALAIASTLDDFAQQASEASEVLLNDFAETGDQDSITELQDFTSTSLDQLTGLEPVVPLDAYDELQNAARVLLQIDAEARQVCPPCAGGITEVPPIFASMAAVTGTSSTQVVTPQTDGSTTGSKDSSGPADQPGVGTGPLPPGSVLNPSQPVQQPSPGSADPLGGLTGTVTGGGASTPTSIPPVPNPGGVLGGTSGDGSSGATGGDGATDGVGGVLDGAGDAVGDAVDGVGQNLP